LALVAIPGSIKFMISLAGPYFMFATLLVITGVPKVTNPGGTARALYTLGLPATLNTERAIGLLETGAGLAALLLGGRAAALAIAIVYVGFSLFIAVALRSEEVRNCGCFGDKDVPPGLLHLGLDVAAAAVATVLVFQPVGAITTVMRETPWAGVPLLLLMAMGAALALLVLRLLPAVAPGRRA
jgi:hypothetical protein